MIQRKLAVGHPHRVESEREPFCIPSCGCSGTFEAADCRDLPDRALAQYASREGSQVAARILFTRHTPSLMGFILSRCGWDQNVAEDVVQDTWLKVFRGLGKFRWESSFLGWLCAIALNCIRDRARLRKGPPEWLVHGEIPVSTPVDLLLKVDLDRAMDKLPGGAKSVFILHDIEGYTHAEVSEALSITSGTSKSQLHRARGILRHALSEPMK